MQLTIRSLTLLSFILAAQRVFSAPIPWNDATGLQGQVARSGIKEGELDLLPESEEYARNKGKRFLSSVITGEKLVNTGIEAVAELTVGRVINDVSDIISNPTSTVDIKSAANQLCNSAQSNVLAISKLPCLEVSNAAAVVTGSLKAASRDVTDLDAAFDELDGVEDAFDYAVQRGLLHPERDQTPSLGELSQLETLSSTDALKMGTMFSMSWGFEPIERSSKADIVYGDMIKDAQDAINTPGDPSSSGDKEGKRGDTVPVKALDTVPVKALDAKIGDLPADPTNDLSGVSELGSFVTPTSRRQVDLD